jgi:hypothetical protein
MSELLPWPVTFRDWKPRPHDNLRGYPNGATFLLRLHTGAIHVCELYGNLPTDESWKARRLSDCKLIVLEKLQNAEFIPISLNSVFPILQNSVLKRKKEAGQ